jgi:hypothetical protein
MNHTLIREIRKLLSLDKFKAIEFMNGEFKRKPRTEIVDEAVQLLAGRTSLFPVALKELQRNGWMSESILRLCYLFAKRQDVEFIKKQLLRLSPKMDFKDLEYSYWTRRQRLDLSWPYREALSQNPTLHAEHFKALIQLKLFKEAQNYFTKHGDAFMHSSELFAFWMHKVMLYQPGAHYELGNIIWEMKRQEITLEHDDIQHIYTSWLRLHHKYVYRKYFVAYEGIGGILGLASSPRDTMKFQFHRQFKMDTPKPTTTTMGSEAWSNMQLPPIPESTQYDMTPLLGFYNWIKSFEQDHSLIRDAMMTVHVQHHNRVEHQQMAEALYSYWNDSALDPIMRILFLKTGQTIKLSAFLPSTTPNHLSI